MGKKIGDRLETAVFIAIPIAMVLAALLGVVMAAAWGCSRRWADSGFEVRWAVGQGCQVHLANGRWVPERAVRAQEE